MLPVTLAAQENTDLFSLAAFCFPETRIWGVSPGSRTDISGSRWITSTLRWGCEQAYDGTVSGRLVGLDYARNRYYSNALGRFLTPDPTNASMDLTNPGSFNRYTYVGNEPINTNDPTGLDGFQASQCLDPAYADTHAECQGPGSPFESGLRMPWTWLKLLTRHPTCKVWNES